MLLLKVFVFGLLILSYQASQEGLLVVRLHSSVIVRLDLLVAL